MSATRRSNPRSKSGPAITVRRLVRGVDLTNARILRAVRHAAGEHVVTDLNVAIVDDVQMSRLHEEYMGDASPTDVLTFDLGDGSADGTIEGEIVVSADTARREAKRRGLDHSEELARYIIHGVLHLLGMDDQTRQDRQRMRREETRILKQLTEQPIAKRATRVAAKTTKKRTRPEAAKTTKSKRGAARSHRPSGTQRKK